MCFNYSGMKSTDLKCVVCKPLSLKGKFQVKTVRSILGVCVCVFCDMFLLVG